MEMNESLQNSILLTLGSMVSLVTFTMVYLCVKKRREQQDTVTHLNFIYSN